MGQSRGGHAAKEDKDEEPQFTIMVHFEDLIIDINDIRRIKLSTRATLEPEFLDGVAYTIMFFFRSPPYEVVFDYQTSEIREKKMSNLRQALTLNRVIIIGAD